MVSLRGFGNWLRKTRRVTANPFDGLPTGNAEVDRRRQRRPIAVEEFDLLLTAARGSAEVVQGLNGPDRAMLHLLGGFTGWRAGALLRLTPEAFTWADGHPAGGRGVAEDAAAGRADLPGERPPPHGRDAAARPGGRSRRLDPRGQDRRRAGAAGRHRHPTHGASLPEVQQVLDHSTPVLTANIYAKFGGQLANTMARLPALSLGTPLETEPFQTPPKVRNPLNTLPPPPKKKPRKS